MNWLFVLFCCIALSLAADPPKVTIPCGETYTGAWDSQKADVAVFKGIRYAQPPVKKLRFMPSVAANCTKGQEFPAVDEPPACIQKRKINQSEDCLFLNVQVPKFSGTELLPIFFWIYGGSNVVGSTTAYAGIENISRLEDVCLVNVNYRVGVMGYLAIKELAAADPRNTTGNFGITDLLLALKWVQTNAKNFGCDASRVILYGQSSGGTNIFALLASQEARGLFHGAISLSGSPNITADLEQTNTLQRPFINLTTCSGKSGAALASCLRNDADAVALTSAMPSTWDFGLEIPGTDSHGFTPWAVPLVFVDGVTVTMPLITALRNGLIDVPLYISTVAEEYDAGPNKTVDEWTWQDLQSKYWNVTFDKNYPAGTVQAVNLFYGPRSRREWVPNKAYYDFLTDVAVTCGNHEVAKAAAFRFTTPVYLVEYNVGLPKPGAAGERQYPAHNTDWAVAQNVSADMSGPEIAAGGEMRFAWMSMLLDKKAYNMQPMPQGSGVATVNLLNRTRDGQSAGFIPLPAYKSPLCLTMENQGFNENFWWIN